MLKKIIKLPFNLIKLGMIILFIIFLIMVFSKPLFDRHITCQTGIDYKNNLNRVDYFGKQTFVEYILDEKVLHENIFYSYNLTDLKPAITEWSTFQDFCIIW